MLKKQFLQFCIIIFIIMLGGIILAYKDLNEQNGCIVCNAKKYISENYICVICPVDQYYLYLDLTDASTVKNSENKNQHTIKKHSCNANDILISKISNSGIVRIKCEFKPEYYSNMANTYVCYKCMSQIKNYKSAIRTVIYYSKEDTLIGVRNFNSEITIVK